MTMQWTRQELPIIATDNDLTNALALYEQLASKDSIDGSDQQFLYLLSLIIGDYEAQHYPIAISSTVDFIDCLLKERSRSWANIRACLGYGDYVSLDFVKSLFEPENMKVEHVIKLSHFFKLTVQAFIVGGYGE